VLLIWGWRSLLKVLGVGEFHCPRCQADRPYQLIRPRRWFTVFFIPVIPLSWGEPFVECKACKGAYRQEILTTPTNAQFSYMLALGARALFAKTVWAGFSHDESMIDRAVSMLQRFVDPAYNEANLVADVQGFSGHGLHEYLSPLAAHASPEGREGLLTAAASFAWSQGTPPSAVAEVISEAGAALQLSPTHVAGIVGAASHDVTGSW